MAPGVLGAQCAVLSVACVGGRGAPGRWPTAPIAATPAPGDNRRMAQPFLKWAGGKAKLAPAVLERAPRWFRRYHEPFLGGGAIFFALAEARPLTAPRLNDANHDLIACYEVVRDEPEALLDRLETLAGEYLSQPQEERATVYYRIRATEPANPLDRAARLIFLNRTCYNGLFRVNSKGRFNVPHGRYRNPRIADRPRILAASAALRDAELACEDFEAACDAAEPGDFVYLDPPYVPLSATARFTAYTAGDFGHADQQRLRDAFDRLTERGVAALLSNSKHEAVERLYADRGYTFKTVPMSRAINSVGRRRAPVPELLIGNLEHPRVREALETLAQHA